ncbi:MAG: endonuclease I family protein [Prevotella sp.]
MKHYNIFFLIVISLLTAAPASAIERKALVDYAQSLKGLKNAELKNAIYRLTCNANVLDYGSSNTSGERRTWWGFYLTDRDAEGYVIDRYSNDRVRFDTQGTAPSGMNIEHSFPKSWWGGAENQAYRDLYNLMPSDMKANSAKSNYGMGIVTSATYDNGCIKVGKGSNSMKLWQPSAEWQGDFSRGYMYMATAYQNLTFTGEGLNSLENGSWPTLKEWAYKLYLEWSRADKVSQVEIDRNNAVASIQGNRNLYVDFPTLAEYVWGDSTNVEFNPDYALTTASDDDRYGSYDPSAGGGEGGSGGEPGNGGEEGGGSEGGSGGEVTPPDMPEGCIFYEPFDDIASGDNTVTSGSGEPWEGCDHFPTATKVYKAGGAARLGASKATGSITSATIPAEGGTLCVSLDVKGWTTVEGSLKVTLTGAEPQTVEYKATINDKFETVTMTFHGVAANPQLTIETTAKRAFVDNVKVYPATSTDITSATFTTAQSEAWFTVSGQRITGQPSRPGIYIIAGHKVVVR